MDIDRGLFLRGWFKSVSRHDDRLQKIGRGHLAWLAMRDEAAHNAVVLADSAREVGFSVEVYYFYGRFAILVTEEMLLLASFTLDSDGIVLTSSDYYPEDLVSSERGVSREYFERMMDWYTDPSTTL